MITIADLRHPLYALTFWQPWGWAMFHGKPVENRTWHPPASLKGQVVAVHAGKRYEREAVGALFDLFDSGHADAPCPPKEAIARGAMIGLARLVGSLVYRDHARAGTEATVDLSGFEDADRGPYLAALDVVLDAVLNDYASLPDRLYVEMPPAPGGRVLLWSRDGDEETVVGAVRRAVGPRESTWPEAMCELSPLEIAVFEEVYGVPPYDYFRDHAHEGGPEILGRVRSGLAPILAAREGLSS